MALLWFDGFDHYGLDETKLIEGPYDQVDAAFTLSEVNPRTGARCLRRDNSAVDGRVLKNWGSVKPTIGAGAAFTLSELPSANYSYALSSLVDSAGSDQITLAINKDGSVRALLGGVIGTEIATSEPGIFNPGDYAHLEFAVRVQSETVQESIPAEFNFLGNFINHVVLHEDNTATMFDETGDPDWNELYADTVDIGSFSYTRYSNGQSLTLPKKIKNVPFYIGWIFQLVASLDHGPGADTLLKLEFKAGGSLVFVMIMDKLSTQKIRIRFGSTESSLSTATTTVGSSGTTLVEAEIEFESTSISFTNTGTTGFNGYVQDWQFSAPFTSVDSIVAESGPTSITNAPSTANSSIGVQRFRIIDIKPVSITEFSDGVLEVRLNGVTIISESSSVTRLSEDLGYSGITINCGSGSAHGVTTDIDDFFIWDDQGAWNNSFLGDKRALLRPPNADTNVSDFEPSSGDFSYQMIDEDSPDEDTTFILAESALLPGSPPSGSSEFEIQNLPNGVSHIAGVSVFTRAAKTDSDDAEISTFVISGVNSVSGSPHELTESYGYHIDLYEYDPATIANFTKDGFDLSLISINAELAPGLGSPEGSPGPDLLLDLFPGALFAYSTRLLTNAYSGPAFRVRRDSDNAEQDIGFDGNGDLDESGLTSFVGANNGYLVTWYDQSGNGTDITESTQANQHIVVQSGTVYKEGSIPAIKAHTTTNGMSTGVTGIQQKSIFTVSNLGNPGGDADPSRIITSYTGSGAVNNELILDRLQSTSTLRYFDGGSSITIGSVSAALHQISAIRTTTTRTLQVDGGSVASNSVGSSVQVNSYKLFEEGGSNNHEVVQSLSELIFYDSDQSANRSGINLDQKTYFGTP